MNKYKPPEPVDDDISHRIAMARADGLGDGLVIGCGVTMIVFIGESAINSKTLDAFLAAMGLF